MVNKAEIAEATGKILFDSSSEGNFISHFFRKQNHTAFQSSENFAAMAKCVRTALLELTNPRDVQINHYE